MKRARDEDYSDVKLQLTEAEEAEAKRLMKIAEDAERRAEERQKQNNITSSTISKNDIKDTKYLTKKEREELALERLKAKRQEAEMKMKQSQEAHDRFVSGKIEEDRKYQERKLQEEREKERALRQQEEKKDRKEIDFEIQAIRKQYLGGDKVEQKNKIVKPSEKFSRIFRFDHEVEDDTTRTDVNPLYNNRVQINALFGRGYIAGIDPREQRKNSNFLISLSERRMSEMKRIEDRDENLTENERRERDRERHSITEAIRNRRIEVDLLEQNATDKSNVHWSEKSLTEMKERDWRIFREDFDIRVSGGKSLLPLRYWNEANFPSEISKAIEDQGYKSPSPIQRQAIPIGRAFRDIIGIAETGSGKTAAFTIPMLCYLMSLPRASLDRCHDEGPLAIVMAPTRELAQQIEEECIKLAKYTNFVSTCIVGGQSIEEQGFKLRKGVHIVIGTPGRLCDCIQNAYLVLNQCNYVVLDEADRMIDMGFEPQVIEVLDAMGSLLKAEDEAQAEQQIENAGAGKTLFRVTAMFSATMSMEVERIAKKYLRHPAIIKIGDEDSGKNKRIEQRVFYVAETAKRNLLLDELRRLSPSDKSIIFINSKQQGDSLGRFLDTSGYRNGVLHGGKSQDQREETLRLFRSSSYKVLVASDVAARGLDISDVSHVFNFECPNKIENYCHRIGRTGRAGKFGIAITYVTDSDTEIMYELKTYLESTNAHIPNELLNHPSAQFPIQRDDRGNIINQKRDKVQYAKK